MPTSLLDTSAISLENLAGQLALGALLGALGRAHGGYELIAHWKQGEFHHDLVLRVAQPGALPGAVLVVATNCNGGVKEVLCFQDVPDRYALWHARCPDNPEFAGELTPLLAEVRTMHWFDPCALLEANARSELKPECRTRQRGGGFMPLV